jgi:hypothetical protein
MVVNRRLHAPAALFPRRELPVPVKYKALWEGCMVVALSSDGPWGRATCRFLAQICQN